MFMIVFLCRYSSIFFAKKQIFYLMLKLIFITLKLITLYLMRVRKPYSITYDKIHDNFPHYTILYPTSFLITLIFHVSFPNHPFYQYFWTFSIVLESVAIIPQLFMIRKIVEFEVFSTSFMLFLGLYRLFYIFNWLLKLYTNKSYFKNTKILHLEIFFGVIQTILFADFIMAYFKSTRRNKHIKIPI